MSLPILTVFESHWCKTSKFVVKRALPGFAELGYDTVCIEAPQNLSAKDLIARYEHSIKENSELCSQAEKLLARRGITEELSEMRFDKLSELMRLFVSSKRYFEMAEKAKYLPGQRLVTEILSEAAKLSIQINGIDIDAEDFDEISSLNCSKRMRNVEANEAYRISVLFKNLLKLRSERTGVIFLCGAEHAAHLLGEFAKKNMQDDVIFCFPCSTKIFKDVVPHLHPDAAKCLSKRIFALSESEIDPFIKKMGAEITAKIRYQREIRRGTANSRFLSDLFDIAFKAFLRPGHYVDALVDETSPKIEAIKKGLHAVGLPFHATVVEKRRYLVVSAINTRPVAEKIHKLA